MKIKIGGILKAHRLANHIFMGMELYTETEQLVDVCHLYAHQFVDLQFIYRKGTEWINAINIAEVRTPGKGFPLLQVL